MNEVTHHCTETDETNEPSNYEKDNEEIDYAVHDVEVYGTAFRVHAAMPTSTNSALSCEFVWNMHPTADTACVTLPQGVAHYSPRVQT